MSSRATSAPLTSASSSRIFCSLYEDLVAQGVTSFVSAPVEVDTGINRGGLALYLRDPDGITVELFQPPSG